MPSPAEGGFNANLTTAAGGTQPYPGEVKERATVVPGRAVQRFNYDTTKPP